MKLTMKLHTEMMNQINCKYFILPVMQCKKHFSLEQEMMLLPVIQAR